MPDTLDRRTVRTRKALRGALLSLLRRKNYDDITVQDIIDEADVGRSTFYAHCRGKQDLLQRALQALRVELEQEWNGTARRSSRTLSFSSKVLEHVASHRQLYPSLGRNRGREIWIREMREVVLALMRRDLAALAYDKTAPREVTEQYVAGAFMALLLWWLERKPGYSPAQVDVMFQRLVMHGIGPAIR